MSNGKMNRMYLHPGWKSPNLHYKKFKTLKQLAPFWYYHQPHDQLFCFLVSEHDFSWILQRVRNMSAYCSDVQNIVDKRGKMCHPPNVYSDKRLVKIEFWLSYDEISTVRCKYVYCVKRSLNARVSCDVVASFEILPKHDKFLWMVRLNKFKDKPGVYDMFISALMKEMK